LQYVVVPQFPSLLVIVVVPWADPARVPDPGRSVVTVVSDHLSRQGPVMRVFEVEEKREKENVVSQRGVP